MFSLLIQGKNSDRLFSITGAGLAARKGDLPVGEQIKRNNFYIYKLLKSIGISNNLII